MASLMARIKSNIQKERLLSVSNFIVMTVTFLALGIFISIIVSSQTALRTLEEQAQLTIFFKDDFPEGKILELKTQIEGDDRVDAAKYVSKQDAYLLFTEINKDDPILLESVSASILPASLEVKTLKLADLNLLAEEYSKIDGVEDVKFFADVVASFRFWSGVVYAVGFVLVLVFFIISYSIILATLRTTIHSKGTEYEIMKLVGASDDYVKQPLIYQGMFFGFVSSLVAGLILVLLVAGLSIGGAIPSSLKFAFIYGASLNSVVYSIILTLILVLSGIGLGYLGSYTAVKRYLNY